jgi:hypothetical protein
MWYDLAPPQSTGADMLQAYEQIMHGGEDFVQPAISVEQTLSK